MKDDKKKKTHPTLLKEINEDLKAECYQVQGAQGTLLLICDFFQIFFCRVNAISINIPRGFCEILQAGSKVCVKIQVANNS